MDIPALSAASISLAATTRGFDLVPEDRPAATDLAPLARRLPGRIGWELRLVEQGGLAILDKIEGVGYDVFTRRPALGKTDWLRLVWRAATR